MRKISFRERFEGEVSLYELPRKIRFIPADYPSIFPSSFVKLAEIASPGRRIQVGPAFVGRWGTVVVGGSLHESSWDYARQTLRQRFAHSRGWARGLVSAPRIKSAVFVAPHLLFGGSYGDYWLEVLCTLCFHAPPPGSRILIFGQDQLNFAQDDFPEMQWEPCLVTERGVWIENLTILEPAQYHGNFTAETVRRIRKCFPRRVATPARGSRTVRNIYLSRSGFERRHGSELARRSLANPTEVEQSLACLGFDIVRAHKHSNAELRELLAGASVVVAEHGAAMFHLIWSPPRKIVEIVTPQWFTPCFIKLSAHLPTEKHIVLATDPDHVLDAQQLVSVLSC